MSIYLWIIELFLVVLWLYCIYAGLNPERAVQLTVDRYKGVLDFYGFKATIKPTPRSVKVMRRGHLLVLLMLTIYIVVIFLFGNAFLSQFA